MSERSGEGWNGYIEGRNPVQGCGQIDGYPWYFRARCDGWSLEIVEDKTMDPERLPMVCADISGWTTEGHYPEAGRMSEYVAWELVIRVFEEFRAGQLRYFAKQ